MVILRVRRSSDACPPFWICLLPTKQTIRKIKATISSQYEKHTFAKTGFSASFFVCSTFVPLFRPPFFWNNMSAWYSISTGWIKQINFKWTAQYFTDIFWPPLLAFEKLNTFYPIEKIIKSKSALSKLGNFDSKSLNANFSVKIELVKCGNFLNLYI